MKNNRKPQFTAFFIYSLHTRLEHKMPLIIRMQFNAVKPQGRYAFKLTVKLITVRMHRAERYYVADDFAPLPSCLWSSAVSALLQPAVKRRNQCPTLSASALYRLFFRLYNRCVCRILQLLHRSVCYFVRISVYMKINVHLLFLRSYSSYNLSVCFPSRPENTGNLPVLSIV